jgi:putative colanic acid biosynthesis UDP-glucose lipid carrier transferase
VLTESLLVSLGSWIVSLYLIRNYRLRRYSRTPKILHDISRLGLIYLGINVMLQTFVLGANYSHSFYLFFHGIFLGLVMLIRVLEIILIKRYRSLGHNFRNVLILGNTPDTKNLERNLFDGNDLGYHLKGVLDKSEYQFEKLVQILKQKEIDEVFISAKQFAAEEFNKIVDYADNNLVKIRVVPNFSGLFASNLKLDYVGYQPVLIYREIVLDDWMNSQVKRAFDIVFSLLVVVFVLSWLMPLMALLIRLESKGPIIFKQSRSGINNKEFDCFKFRSMTVNSNANNIQASKGDARITKIGSFIRKTSIDELPQFINVLLGDMSVVGPRPHMVKHTEEFSNVVDRYMLRHFVKPGITGLAQTMGYRGETKTKQDIKGRITLDRFYIENWNFFLDIKIIYDTFLNGVKGEDKAY